MIQELETHPELTKLTKRLGESSVFFREIALDHKGSEWKKGCQGPLKQALEMGTKLEEQLLKSAHDVQKKLAALLNTANLTNISVLQIAIESIQAKTEEDRAREQEGKHARLLKDLDIVARFQNNLVDIQAAAEAEGEVLLTHGDLFHLWEKKGGRK